MNENRKQLNYMIICTVKYLDICHPMLNYGIWRLFISNKQTKCTYFFKINTRSNLCGFSNANELKKNAHIKKI